MSIYETREGQALTIRDNGATLRVGCTRAKEEDGSRIGYLVELSPRQAMDAALEMLAFAQRHTVAAVSVARTCPKSPYGPTLCGDCRELTGPSACGWYKCNFFLRTLALQDGRPMRCTPCLSPGEEGASVQAILNAGR